MHFAENCLRTQKKLHNFALSKGKKKLKLQEKIPNDSFVYELFRLVE